MSDAQPLNRIERRKLEFRQKIIEAALQLFEQRGVNETSVAAIIQQADIAHKTFFNHFPSKDHLLRHIACSFSDNAYRAFREGLGKHSDPRKRIAYCLRNIAITLDKAHAHYKQLLNLYLISGAVQGDLRRQQRQQFSQLINEIIADAGARKLLRPGFKPEALSEVIIGLCVSTLLAWSLEDDYPITTKMDAVIAFINASVFAYE